MSSGPVRSGARANTINTDNERSPALSDNIEIITRFEHAFRANDQATIDELCDPGLVDHNPAPDQEPPLPQLRMTPTY